MHIVIPMSGTGQRFIAAGYKDPKPLIKADGKPIIEHVVGLFPGETKFTFICNGTHLRETNMREELQRIAPTGEIVEIAPHKKGPVFAVAQVFDRLDDDEEVIVNYCDFGTYWDYDDFLDHTRKRDADGAVVSYRGFHPHMLGPTNYAFQRDKDQWMLEIKEKEPFTDNRMEEFASNGTYYFKKGAYVKKYFQALMDRDVNLNGEFYVSLIYNLLVEDGLKVSIYDVQHMLQWGTPRDLEEYHMWSDYFASMTREHAMPEPLANSINLIPLAGRGSRFSNEGYELPKPLLPVSGKPMIRQASESLPPAEKNVFVCLGEHLDTYPLEDGIRGRYPDAEIKRLDEVTEGQAITASLGLEGQPEDAPVLIAASDNAVLIDSKKYAELVNDAGVDAIAFTFRGNPTSERNPGAYGWVPVDGEDTATGVSVKKAISEDPLNDHAIVGAFWFRSAGLYRRALERLIKNNNRVNNEFYIDSMLGELVEMGHKVKVFQVDHYICWGTPNDYKTYEYWQSYFHKCKDHPYRLEKDVSITPEAVAELDARYGDFKQAHR